MFLITCALTLILSFIPGVYCAISSNVRDAMWSMYNDTHADFWNWKNEFLYGPVWDFTSPENDPCAGDGDISWQAVVCSQSASICSRSTSTCAVTDINLQYYGLIGNI